MKIIFGLKVIVKIDVTSYFDVYIFFFFWKKEIKNMFSDQIYPHRMK